MNKKELKALRRPFLKELFRGNKFNLAMTVAAALLTALGELVVSWLLKEVADLISGDCPYTFTVLLCIAGGGFALYGLAWMLDRAFLSEFRAKAMKQYRAYAFERLMGKGIQAFSGENSSLYISALSNDVNTIETDFIGKLKNTIEVGVAFIGALGLMLWYSPLLTMVAIGFSLLPIVVSIVLGNKAAEAEKSVSDKKESYTGMLKDALTGFAVIKSFKAERNIARIHEQSNGGVAEASRKRTGVNVHVSYASELAGGILQFGVFFVAAALALSGRGGITAGTAIVFVQLLNYVLAPIQIFPTFFAGAKASFGLIDKLAQALDKNIPDEGEQIPPQLTDGISVRDLSFSYEEGKTVLRGIGMDMKAGGCYALVGGSGSGKSTILNLLMASSEDYRGEILYDGRELRSVSPSSLYDLVSIIQQNVFVFNSTIRDNITMFSEFPEDEIERAVRLSGLSKLVDERGADYLCGENGSGLSGGERQRISIARALLRKTPVLFVDEATASLDAETSFEVLDAILKLDGYTRVIVTHDLDENILRRCTGLFTLKNGTVFEEGTFDGLMDKKGYFYSLFTVSQRE
ncbi:MAG: ABC transporter ATP-binding protein/permease [Clostridiales bacterium]|nr:ABC transporter ATP-binding protein/permease [Clostridiales bacterium]